MKQLVHLLRYTVGAFFIFSGVVKGIDPMGTAIKMGEYFTVFSESFPFMEGFFMWMNGIALPFSMFMIILEIILGISLILGTFMVPTLMALFGMIVFFTLLTGFTLYTGKVTDCGCFGDFMKLKPIETFGKDVVLTILIAVIWLLRDKMTRFDRKEFLTFLGIGAAFFLVFGLLTNYGFVGKMIVFLIAFSGCAFYAFLQYKEFAPRMIMIGLVVLSVIGSAFTFSNHFDLPIVDFRAYKVGTAIADCTSDEGLDPGETQKFFTMKNTSSGATKEVDSDDYMSQRMWEDKTWELVKGETRELIIREAEEPKCKDFMIYNSDGESIEDEVIHQKGVVFWVSSHNYKKASQEGFKRIAALMEQAQRDGHKVYGLTGSEISLSEKATGNVVKFNNLDAVPIKTMNRSNPGLIMLKDGVVMGKWHHNHLDDYASMKKDYNF